MIDTQPPRKWAFLYCRTWKRIHNTHKCRESSCAYIRRYWHVAYRLCSIRIVWLVHLSSSNRWGKVNIYTLLNCCLSSLWNRHEMFLAKIYIFQFLDRKENQANNVSWLENKSNSSWAVHSHPIILLWGLQPCLICCNKAFNLIWYLAHSSVWHSSQLFYEKGSFRHVSKNSMRPCELAPIFLLIFNICIEYNTPCPVERTNKIHTLNR